MKPPYHPQYQIAVSGPKESIITPVLRRVLSSHGLNFRKDSPQGAITSITFTSYSDYLVEKDLKIQTTGAKLLANDLNLSKFIFQPTQVIVLPTNPSINCIQPNLHWNWLYWLKTYVKTQLPELQLYFIRISYVSSMSHLFPPYTAPRWPEQYPVPRPAPNPRKGPCPKQQLLFPVHSDRIESYKRWIVYDILRKGRDEFWHSACIGSGMSFLCKVFVTSLFNEMIDGEPKNDDHSETVMHWERERIPNGYSMMPKHDHAIIL